MAFRRSASIQDLGKHLPTEEREKFRVELDPARGGYYPPEEKPVPGTPNGSKGRLRRR